VKVKKNFSSSTNIFLFLSFLFLSFSLYPAIYEIFTSANILPGRILLLEHNFLPDYNAYLSKILQGIQGNWLVYEKLTSEPHAPSLLQIFYLILGKIGSLFTANPAIVYLAARIIFGFLRLFAGWLFISLCFSKKSHRLIAFILFAISAGFPAISQVDGKTIYDLYLSGWSHLEPMRKLTFIPHWIAGHTLIASCLYLFIRLKDRFNLKKILPIGILGLILGLTLPSGLLLFYQILILFLVFQFLKKNPRLKIIVKSAFIIFLTSVPSLIYIKYTTSQFPWNSLVADDLKNRLDFPFAPYFKALGPTFYLGIAAIPVVIYSSLKTSQKWARNLFRGGGNYPAVLLSAFYALSALASLYFIDLFIHTNHGRFVQLNIVLPLAVLTVISLNILSQISKKYQKLMFYFIFFIILIPSFVSNFISIRNQITFIRDRQRASIPDIPTLPHVIYPQKEWFDAILWFKDNSNPQDRVFSAETAGSYIPAYSGNHVFYGHGSQTAYYDKKTPIVIAFYAGQLSINQIKKIFTDHKIKYVFYGPQEKEWGTTVQSYQFLKLVYNTLSTTIYKVKF